MSEDFVEEFEDMMKYQFRKAQLVFKITEQEKKRLKAELIHDSVMPIGVILVDGLEVCRVHTSYHEFKFSIYAEYFREEMKVEYAI